MLPSATVSVNADRDSGKVMEVRKYGGVGGRRLEENAAPFLSMKHFWLYMEVPRLQLETAERSSGQSERERETETEIGDRRADLLKDFKDLDLST